MADPITGTSYNEVINGTDDDDVINGLSGYDTLDGGEGSDVYLVNRDDFLGRYVDFYNDTGTSGIDVIQAVESDTDIGIGHGFGDNSGIEIIDGVANSRIVGENEIQTWDFTNVELRGIIEIFGSGGNDVIYGSAAGDNILGGADHDSLYGGLGNDRLLGNSGNDLIFGELGNDKLYGGVGHDELSGGEGEDKLFGGEGHDRLFGGEGADQLFGGAGYDYLDGGEGADRYYVGLENEGFVDQYVDSGTSGKDKIIARDDGTVIGLHDGFGPSNGIEIITSGVKNNVTIGGTNDHENWDFSNTILRGITMINSGGGRDIVVGTARVDTIHAGSGHDQLYGGHGNDALYGGENSDFLYGEDGNDTLFGEHGHDILDGGLGNDTLTGGHGYDMFAFGPDSGHDVVTDFNVRADLIDMRAFEGALTYEDVVFVQGETGLTLIMGDSSVLLENIFLDSLTPDMFIFPDIIIDDNATLYGGNGSDFLEGGSGDDTLFGSHGNDTLLGHGGKDTLYGGNGNDMLDGGNGNDTLWGSHGNDHLIGGTGNDYLDGGNNEDILEGDDGADTLLGFNGRDTLLGGAGNDLLDGGNDDDILDGGAGNDWLEGFNGRDTLNGGSGDDTLSGYNDDDILTGGTGDDTLTGGWGNDLFVFNESDGMDTITDFETGRDTVDLTDFNYHSFDDLNFVQGDNNNVFLVIDEYQMIEFEGINNINDLSASDFLL